MNRSFLVLLAVLFASCTAPVEYDVIVRNGTIYDGLGGDPYVGDVAIQGDSIAAVGALGDAIGRAEVDATGLAVAPGFINMLSWATTTLIEDGRSESDIRQGVTLEVFGEGWSYGPLNEDMRSELIDGQSHIRFDVPWTTLDQYLEHLVERGVSPNVASFIGAGTVRIHELGYEDREPNAEELERMKELVRQAMEDGALGVGSSLIYAPDTYASTEELIALAKVAAEYDGLYISHIRSEGNRFLEALDELIRIASEAGIRAEIYHLKAAGSENWNKLEAAIERIEAARDSGLAITADVYAYTAGATGLDAAMPPWVQEGGFGPWRERLMDQAIRRKVISEMRTRTDEWENLMMAAGPAGVKLVGFRKYEHQDLIGKTLAELSEERGVSPEDVAVDLVIADSSRVESVYFVMSEENVRRKIALPWVAFDSDAESAGQGGVFTNWNPHPRAYGNFARLLGKYVREEQIIPLKEAIRRLTSFPAENLRIQRRGSLRAGNFADIVIFDPNTIIDHATYDEPRQYATGMHHVFVNGEQVLRDGEHTGALPGRVVRGPGHATPDF
ncbi:MAG TPA: D-aminoacylase [Rhodothermales bacterium]|nr:D-aminoacylase [Rhodothermales bacterium]